MKTNANRSLKSFIFWFAPLIFLHASAQPVVTFTPFLQNLSKPIYVTNAADSSGRLFIVEQSGTIRIWKNSYLNSEPFLDIRQLIDTGTYKGLFAVAFPPDYRSTANFFVFYTDKEKNTIIARYSASKENPDSAINSSGVILLSIVRSQRGAPYLGDMHFGPDTCLYISINDGSFYSDNMSTAQDGSAFPGKILRLKVNNPNAPYYSIPADNPFINDSNFRPEIWALGARNFWRWSFDRANGNMWTADNGESHWDEVNVRRRKQPGGANYGWPCYEGNDTFNLTNCKSRNSYAFPIFTTAPNPVYDAQAIIGGYVYRGKIRANRTLRGYYICSDYVSSDAWLIRPDGSGGYTVNKQAGIAFQVSTYGEGEDGELYAASQTSGIVYKIGVAPTSLFAETSTADLMVASDNGIKIYPTLVNSNSINIESAQSIKTISLTDLSGRIVFSQKLSGFAGKTTVQLPSSINAGWYLLTVTGSKNTMQKIYISR